ncbi:unnamed protein product, partial [Ascophyllum nodosum]
MPRRSPIAQSFWGGAHLMLLLATAASASPSLEEQISPFARWTARNQFERLRKVYNGADAQLSSPFLTVSTTTEGRVGLPVKPASVFDEGAWQVFNEKWNDFEEGRPRRMLQGTCDGEFTITSNVAPVLEGCFQNTASETTSTFNGQEVYGIVPDGQGGATTLVYAFVVDTAFDSLLRWIIVYFTSDTTTVGTWYCYSDESADEVHPTDATWICDFSGAASDFAEVTALDLAVACGCSGITPSPSTLIGPVDTLAPFTPSPVTITSAPFSVVGSPMPSSTAMVTCDGEFSVTSNVAPVLEGCFQNTASETTSTFNGQEVYGIVPDGQGSATTLIYAFVVDTAFDSLLRWVIVYFASDTTTVGTWYCYSDESADEVHPTDATWICDFSGAASDFAEVTALDLAVACGCSGITPSPSTLIEPVDTLAPFTPSPVTITSAPFSVVGSPMPSSTVTVTCDGEFSVTSNVAPVLEGCFQNTASETTSTFNGQEVYGIVPDSDTTTVGTLYCYSDESADEVHPTDATWICDVSGAGSDFAEVTALDLAVACGCSGITPSPSTLIEPVD